MGVCKQSDTKLMGKRKTTFSKINNAFEAIIHSHLVTDWLGFNLGYYFGYAYVLGNRASN